MKKDKETSDLRWTEITLSNQTGLEDFDISSHVHIKGSVLKSEYGYDIKLGVDIPEGYKIDKEESTYDTIKLIKEPQPMTWDRLVAAQPHYGEPISRISSIRGASKRSIRKWIAEYKIDVLMWWYCSPITEEEWKNEDMVKYAICKYKGRVTTMDVSLIVHKLAFNTDEMRLKFLKNNIDIVNDYLGIESK